MDYARAIRETFDPFCGAACDHLTATREHIGRQRGADCCVVNDPGVGRMQGGNAIGVWLNFTQLVATELRHAHTVRQCSLVQHFKPRQLSGRGRDDQLADRLCRHAELGAEPVERRCPLNAELRLQRAGLVIDPGMNNAAVM